MFDSKCRWSYFRKSTYHLAYVIIAKVLAQLKRPVIQHMVLKKIPLLKPILFIVLSSKAECFKECQRVCSCTQRGQKIQLLINKMTDEETQKYWASKLYSPAGIFFNSQCVRGYECVNFTLYKSGEWLKGKRFCGFHSWCTSTRK